MSFAHTLKKLGFSDKKTAVYLALLSRGESSVRELMKETGIRRTTIYDILDNLVKEQLVSEAPGGDKKTFLAEDPKRLTDLVDGQVGKMADEKKRLEERQEELKELIPQLKSLGDAAIGRPAILFFDGAKGLVEALNDCLLQKQPLSIYGSLDPWKRWMPDHFEWYASEVEKRKIEVKRIEQKTIDKLRGMTADEVSVDWPVRYLPVGFNLPGFTMIYGAKVMLASFQKPMATIVDDKDYGISQKAIFDVFWQFLREG